MFAVGLLFLTSCANGTPNVVAAIGLLPASFVFIIPYSEGAMFVSLAIGMGAAMRRWHVLSRVALFAAGMSRPAVIFFVAALPLRRIYVLVGFCLCLVFSAFSGYATPWNFAVLGLILTCISIYLIVLPAPRSLIFWAFYVLPAVFWHAHMVNMLLRDAWIVT
jgi:hypothetical protein